MNLTVSGKKIKEHFLSTCGKEIIKQKIKRMNSK